MKGVFSMADLSSIVSGIGDVSTWFWGRFTDFLGIITSNSLILWAVIFSVVAASIYGLLKVIRRFGVKTKR